MLDASTATASDVVITYIEFNKNDVKNNADVSTSQTPSEDRGRYNSTYALGMPPRNQTWN
jgi:hypothetical protein